METSQHHRVRQTLKQAGLPNFVLGANGFPLPGPVVRYYREHMLYTDTDGNTKHWTQIDLAQRLNLSERTIRLMESENKFLDSLEKRQTLATLLKIPPVLLGLASFEQLIDAANLKQTTPSAPHVALQKAGIGEEEVHLYRDALPVLTEAYDQNTLKSSIIEAWIERITKNVDSLDNKQKNIVVELLIRYHILAGRFYSNCAMNWIKATNHFNTATQLTKIGGNPDLKALIYRYIGSMYLNQKNELLAENVFDRATMFAKDVSPHVMGHVLGYTALTHAMTGTSIADTTSVHKLLEQAETCALDTGNSDLIVYDTFTYLRDKADTLITLKEYKAARDALEDAEYYLSNKKNNASYLRILQSECYIKQKQPEYEEAVKLLSQVLEASSNVRYYVKYVARLHKLITTSPYGNSPDVADVGMRLRELSRK